MRQSFAKALRVAAVISVGLEAVAAEKGMSPSAHEHPAAQRRTTTGELLGRRALMRHVVALSDPTRLKVPFGIALRH